MADLVLTPSAVVPSANSQIQRGIAGETILQGQPVHKAADGSIKLADANAAAPANSVAGIALNGAALGQPVNYTAEDPDLVLGGVLTQGLPYFLSATAGKICPAADLATGMTGISLGMAKSASVLNFKPVVGGVVA